MIQNYCFFFMLHEPPLSRPFLSCCQSILVLQKIGRRSPQDFGMTIWIPDNAFVLACFPDKYFRGQVWRGILGNDCWWRIAAMSTGSRMGFALRDGQKEEIA
jgi:hypothetical protein